MKKATTLKNLMFLSFCLIGSAVWAEEPEMQLDSVIQYNNNGGNDSKYLKTEYTYDLRGNETLKIIYSWTEASDGTLFWMYSQSSDKAYDDRNRLKTQADYTWNSNAGVWTGATRKGKELFYNEDNGRIDSIFYYRWEGYDWLDTYEKEVYTYSDDGLHATAVWYKDLDYENEKWPTAWQPAEKREYVYDEGGRVLSQINYVWAGFYPSGEWAASDKDEYTYNEHGNVLTYVKYMSILGGWVEGENYKLKHEYTYDERGNVASDKTYRSENGQWYPDTDYRYEYFYSPVPAAIKEIPYREAFDSQDAMDDYTIWDADNDGTDVWMWDNGAVKSTQREEVGDYLFTPAFHLPVTHRYRVTFKARCENADAGAKLTVNAYNAANPNNVVYPMLDKVNIANVDYQTYTATFLIPQEANFYVGFNAYTADGSAVYLDDIAVEQDKSVEVPDRVPELVGFPAAGGVNQVTLMFYIPNFTLGGMLFNGVNGYVIERDDMTEPICKVEKFQIRGSIITWVDENAGQGENTYSVYTYNEFGNSDKVEVTVTVGTDYPGKIRNLKAEEPAVGVCKLTWEAPDKGAAGGDFTTEGLTYNIYRYLGAADELIANVPDLTYTDNEIEVSNLQVPVQYSVAAVNKAGEGVKTSTDVLLLGNPYPVPFHESFAGCQFQNYLWTTIGIVGASAWGFIENGLNPDVSPQDKDGGMMIFSTLQFMPGNMARLTSPKIDISQADKPMLDFYMAHSTNTGVTVNGNDVLVVKISADNGTYEKLDSIFVQSDKDGWVKHSYSLNAYKGCTNIRLGLIGVVGRTNNIYIDNISVTDAGESSISTVADGQVGVYGNEGFITVEGVEDERITISTIDGKVVYSSGELKNNVIPVRSGLYLVSVGNRKVIKVIVR